MAPNPRGDYVAIGLFAGVYLLLGHHRAGQRTVLPAMATRGFLKEEIERASVADKVKVAEQVRKLDLKEAPAAVAFPGGVSSMRTAAAPARRW
jgi:hypothetical protein